MSTKKPSENEIKMNESMKKKKKYRLESMLGSDEVINLVTASLKEQRI